MTGNQTSQLVQNMHQLNIGHTATVVALVLLLSAGAVDAVNELTRSAQLGVTFHCGCSPSSAGLPLPALANNRPGVGRSTWL